MVDQRRAGRTFGIGDLGGTNATSRIGRGRPCAASLNNTLTKSGKNSANFIDGASIYSKTAYETYKNECSICGFNILPSLEIHHIDKNRKNGDKDNLIILCANCHCQVHYGNLVIDEEIKNNRKLL